MIEIIVALIMAGIPASVTIWTTARQNRETRKNAAKQSVLQMVLEDYVMYGRGRFPTNYGQIQIEYDKYHANGGNGEVTKKVKEYNDWYADCENKLRKDMK